MLVMDIDFERMQPYFGDLMGGKQFIYMLDKGTHWEFYMSIEPNIVLRSTKEKMGGEQDALFIAQLPKTRLVSVQSVVWGKHVAVTSILEETKEVPGVNTQDIAPDDRHPEE